MSDINTAIAAAMENVHPEDIKPLPMQANVLQAVCDHIVNGITYGRKPKEIRLGNRQWEKFIEQCDKRAILGVRIVHVISTESLFEVVR